MDAETHFQFGCPIVHYGVFIRVKSNKSGSVSIQVLAKRGRKNVLVKTIGSSKDPAWIEQLKADAHAFIGDRMGQSELAFVENHPDWFGAIFERISFEHPWGCWAAAPCPLFSTM